MWIQQDTIGAYLVYQITDPAVLSLLKNKPFFLCSFYPHLCYEDQEKERPEPSFTPQYLDLVKFDDSPIFPHIRIISHVRLVKSRLNLIWQGCSKHLIFSPLVAIIYTTSWNPVYSSTFHLIDRTQDTRRTRIARTYSTTLI